MKKRLFIFFVLALLPGLHPDSALAENDRAKAIIFILDTSKSMAEYLPATGRSKLDGAREALSRTIANLEYAGGKNEFALITYKGCEPVVTAPLSGTGAAITAALTGIRPTGKTPLAASLELAYVTLQKAKTGSGWGHIILLSDGGESCNGDPLAAALRIKQETIKSLKPEPAESSVLFDLVTQQAWAAQPRRLPVALSVIGFTLGHGSSEESHLKRIASCALGNYYAAENLAELVAALNKSATESFELDRFIVKEGAKPVAVQPAPVTPALRESGKSGGGKKVWLVAVIAANLLLLGIIGALLLFRKKCGGK
jgi:Mg-chelatase subunit ChlD